MKSQRLFLPDNCTVYKRTEYGILLMSNDSMLYSCGYGWIRSMGKSPIFGGFVCVVYDGVLTEDNQNIGSVLIRYCNLSQISVKKGKKVTSGTLLGKIESRTGYGYPIYLEADKDIRFSNYTPALERPSGDLRAGCRGEKDTTFCPLIIFY